jgi:hypothetical protein
MRDRVARHLRLATETLEWHGGMPELARLSPPGPQTACALSS